MKVKKDSKKQIINLRKKMQNICMPKKLLNKGKIQFCLVHLCSMK